MAAAINNNGVAVGQSSTFQLPWSCSSQRSGETELQQI
jgi:hypothetical protein